MASWQLSVGPQPDPKLWGWGGQMASGWASVCIPMTQRPSVSAFSHVQGVGPEGRQAAAASVWHHQPAALGDAPGLLRARLSSQVPTLAWPAGPCTGLPQALGAPLLRPSPPPVSVPCSRHCGSSRGQADRPRPRTWAEWAASTAKAGVASLPGGRQAKVPRVHEPGSVGG